jgi:hypothetical protein
VAAAAEQAGGVIEGESERVDPPFDESSDAATGAGDF